MKELNELQYEVDQLTAPQDVFKWNVVDKTNNDVIICKCQRQQTAERIMQLINIYARGEV